MKLIGINFRKPSWSIIAIDFCWIVYSYSYQVYKKPRPRFGSGFFMKERWKNTGRLFIGIIIYEKI